MSLRAFKPYPKYKDSGVDWLGKIPVHWEAKRLKRLFKVVNGSTPRSEEPSYWDGDIPWVTPDDLGELTSTELLEPRRYITEDGYHSCGTSMVPKGSLILSTRAPIGHLAIAGVNLCTNQGCRSLVFCKEHNRYFFYYLLFAARSELESWGQGSTFMELSKTKLEYVSLTNPPFHEQCAIAEFLDRETAKIDTLIAKKERVIELLQEKRTALITRAVIKGLDPNVPMKDSGVEWLGEIPEHWEVKSLRHILLGGTQNGLYKERGYYHNDGIPMIQMGEAFAFPIVERCANDRVRLTPSELLIWKLEEGDLLFARRSLVFEGSGKCSIVGKLPEPHVFESSLIRARPNRSVIEPLFLYWFLQCHFSRSEILAMTKKVTISGVDSQQIKALMVVVPPRSEQKGIIKHVEERNAEINSLIAKILKAIERLKEYRTALISAAVIGKINLRGETA
jgi:type I restriction enzyme S subunit